MRRHEVSDKLWVQIEPMIPGRGKSNDDRLFVNAVLFHAKTGLPWRDLPERFGKWYSIYQRYNRWAKLGIWEKIFELTADPEPMVILADSTTVRANQVAAGQKKTEARPAALGRSRGGLSTKIHLAVNAIGRICRTIVGPGHQSDYRQAGALIKGYSPMIAMADKGYDANWFIHDLEAAGVAEVVIPSRKGRKVQREIDPEKYKGRNVIERTINRLKYYRRIATRFDKLARNYEGFIFLAAAVLNAKFIL